MPVQTSQSQSPRVSVDIESPVETRPASDFISLGNLHIPHPDHARITSDGMMIFRGCYIPSDSLDECLGEVERVCKVAQKVWSAGPLVSEFLAKVGVDLPTAPPLKRQVAALERLLSEGSLLREIRDVRHSLSTPTQLSSEKLAKMRDVLMEGACIAASSDMLDGIMMQRARLPRALRSLLSKLPQGVLQERRWIDTYQSERPFVATYPQSLYLRLDYAAQLIEPRDDGAKVILDVVSNELQVAEILSAYNFVRDVCITDGALSTRVALVPKADGSPYEVTHSLQSIAQVLELAHQSVPVLEEWLRVEVNFVRMCGMARPELSQAMAATVSRITQQSLARLSTCQDWIARLRGDEVEPLSGDDRRDLAVHLIDAEALMLFWGAVQCMILPSDSARYWRSQWARRMYDREVGCALTLLNMERAPHHYNCADAAQLASQAVHMLGFRSEDYVQPGWHLPENPVASLTWLLSHVASEQREDDGQ